jgi:hypothetical protein
MTKTRLYSQDGVLSGRVIELNITGTLPTSSLFTHAKSAQIVNHDIKRGCGIKIWLKKEGYAVYLKVAFQFNGKGVFAVSVNDITGCPQTPQNY